MARDFQRFRSREQSKPEGPQLIEKLIGINRVAKVHKGGKRLGFNALAVVGDGKGRVGIALGRSNEAADAIRKGFQQAQRNMVAIALKGTTIPHEIIGHSDASEVLLKPASPGTGIIAGGPVRAVCEAAGIRDILTKRLGSSNAVNLVKATLNGLVALEPEDRIRERRRLVVDISETA
jgi:small subunit ribosomal protein S5